MKTLFKNTAGSYPFPENQRESIEKRLSKKKGEVIIMKKSTVIKAAAAALALIVTSGSIGFAAGRASQFYSWGTPVLNGNFSDYEETVSSFSQDEMVEAFSNGYKFTGFSSGGSAVKDDDGNTMGKGDRLDATYEKDGNTIMLSVEKGSSTMYDDISTSAAAEFNEGDITYYFHELKNKFVPTDYEPTEEEQSLVDSGELNIGYGSDKVEENISQSLYWQKDGKTYSLFGFDTGLSAEDLLQMALEIQ